MPESFSYSTPSDSESEIAVDRANAWVARFAPLVMDEEAVTEEDLRRRIATTKALQAEGPEVQALLSQSGDPDLKHTVERALSQLESVETDLRRRLAKLAPGDPQGLPDLEQLNEKLDERMARQELGLPTGLETPEVLQLQTSPPNLAVAGGMGLFGFGWTSFTSFHAFFMIGGMMKAFGIVALALLGFYAIFFGVGFAMLSTALNAACRESIELDGNRLKVIRKLGFWVREKAYILADDTLAEIAEPQTGGFTNRNQKIQPTVVLADVDGKQISLAANASESQKQKLRDTINAYLKAKRA